MLVTALEANAEVPKLELVTERLLHEERKMKDRKGTDTSCDKVMTAKQPFKRGPKCHYCGKFGHIKRNCRKLAQETKSDSSNRDKPKHGANAAEARQTDSSSSDSEIVVRHAFSASASKHDSWIVDSGATGHMCHDKRLFVELPLEMGMIYTQSGVELSCWRQSCLVVEQRNASCKMCCMCQNYPTTY